MPAIVGLKRLHGALMQCWRKLMRFEPLWYLKTLSLKGVDLPDAIDYSCRARRPNLRRPPGSKRYHRAAPKGRSPERAARFFSREHPAQRMSPQHFVLTRTAPVPRVVGSFQPLAEHHAAPVSRVRPLPTRCRQPALGHKLAERPFAHDSHVAVSAEHVRISLIALGSRYAAVGVVSPGPLDPTSNRVALVSQDSTRWNSIHYATALASSQRAADQPSAVSQGSAKAVPSSSAQVESAP